MTIHGNLTKALEHMAQAGLKPIPCFDALTNITAAAALTSSDLEDVCTDVYLKVAELSAETVQVQGTVDGTVWSAAIMPFVATTENYPAAAATLGNGTYRFPLHLISQFRKLKVVKSAGVGNSVGGFYYSKLPRKR